MEKTRILGTSYDPQAVEQPGDGDIYIYKDGLVPFLYLKVSSASKGWVFVKTYAGKTHKRKIGDAMLIGLPEARLRAYDWARDLERGELPPTLASRRAETTSRSVQVKTLFQRYYDDHLKHQARTHEEIMRGFGAYWDDIRNKPASSITSTVLQQWVNRIAIENGKPTATKQFTSLRACLNYAHAHGWIKLAPEQLSGVKTFKSEESREYLKVNEVPSLDKALEAETHGVRDAIRMCLYTMQRKGNVLSMRWDEINFDTKMWVIPAGKTKSKRTYHIALTSRALAILEERKKTASGEYVFESSRTEHLKYINKAWLSIRKRAGLKNLRIHDLRHTGATWLAESGAPSVVIKEALQHSNLSTSERYIHVAAEIARERMEQAQSKLG